MVESSFGLIIVLLLIFGIIEFAQLIMARQLMNVAAISAGRIASVGEQPATYSDGTATPSPGSAVTSAFLTTYINKALAAAPLTSITPTVYGSNTDGSPNTSIAWTSMQYGQGFYVTIKATYVPLFSGNRLTFGSTSTGPMVGAITLTRTYFFHTEANQ